MSALGLASALAVGLATTTTAWGQVPAEPAPEPAPEPPAEPSPPEPGEPPLALPADPSAPAPAPDPSTGSEPAEAATAEPAPTEEPPPVVERIPREPGLARYALSLEVASVTNHDPNFDLFSRGDVIGSVGVSAGVRPIANLAIIGSWQPMRRGALITVDGTDTVADFTSGDTEFVAAYNAHELTLGAKVDFGIQRVIRPYAAAQGALLLGRMRFDDEPTLKDNPGQVSATGTSVGGVFTAGTELRLPPDTRFQVAWYLEFGHTVLTTATFGEIGTLRAGGFTARSGLGVRF